MCSFNPIYGQGMTAAAFEASYLAECLTAGSAKLAKRFFAGASRLIDTPWLIAATADFRFPEVRGHRPWGTAAMNWYLARLHRAAHHDPVVAIAFHRVANLLDPPPALFHPRIVSRVVMAAWRGPTPLGQRPQPLPIPQVCPGMCRRFV